MTTRQCSASHPTRVAYCQLGENHVGDHAGGGSQWSAAPSRDPLFDAARRATGEPRPTHGIMCGDSGCRHVDQATFGALWDLAKKAEAKRAADMPDEKAAIKTMFDGFVRLKEAFGWRDALYAPKNVEIEMIEVGSTGVHTGYRDDIGFWISADSDLYPSRPALFRIKKATSETVPPISLQQKSGQKAAVNPQCKESR